MSKGEAGRAYPSSTGAEIGDKTPAARPPVLRRGAGASACQLEIRQ